MQKPPTSPSQNPWLIGKFYSKDFKYRVGHNWINMPSNIGGNYGSNFVWTTSNSGASVCPSQYGVNSSVFNDPYWWFMGTGGSQCNNLLYTGGGPNTAVTNILADSIGKFVSSNNSTNYMKADRILPADWEEWKIQPVSGGKTAFQANTGKWASSNNGTNYMKADKNTIGSWEKFTKVNLDGSGLYFALKANNGKYVSHNNGTNYMKADRNTIGSWEKFRFVAH